MAEKAVPLPFVQILDRVLTIFQTVTSKQPVNLGGPSDF